MLTISTNIAVLFMTASVLQRNKSLLKEKLQSLDVKIYSNNLNLN